MINNININKMYMFSFQDRFSDLDGVYRVMAILNYDDVLANDIDIKKSLYDIHDIPTNDFLEDFKNFESTDFIKLNKIEDNNTSTIIYVPEFIIVGEPKFSLVEVTSLGITLRIGAWANKEAVEQFCSEVADLAEARLGEVTRVIPFSIGKLYMDIDQYAILADSRKTIRQSSTSLTKKVNDLNDEISSLKVIITALEDIIKNQ